MNTMQRMLTLSTGKRLSLKLDDPTWHAVDWLAAQRGKSWQDWCAEILNAADEAENMTAALREAVMSRLLSETVLADRHEQHAAMASHPLMRDSGTLDDAALSAMLSNGAVTGRSDFGGFEVIFGFDEHGQDCVWIQNGLRNGLHLCLLVPAGLARSAAQ